MRHRMTEEERQLEESIILTKEKVLRMLEEDRLRPFKSTPRIVHYMCCTGCPKLPPPSYVDINTATADELRAYVFNDTCKKCRQDLIEEPHVGLKSY